MTECERLIAEGIFSPDFFKEEVRNDFLVNETRKKIWAIVLDLLLKFDTVCKKHELKYCLIGGSLLGAIRHKGFIPWDDDIDVGMLRPDYEKFLQLAHEFEEPYFLQTPYTDPQSAFSSAKIKNSQTSAISKMLRYQRYNHGIFLDVFPLDYFEVDGGKERFDTINKLILENGTYMRISNPYLNEENRKRVENWSGRNPLKTYEEIQQLCMSAGEVGAENVALLACPIYGYDRSIFQSEDFSEIIDWEFEGFSVPIPKGYDRILKTVYGNYWEFPPVSQRGEWHNHMVFDPDTPYLELLKHMDDVV